MKAVSPNDVVEAMNMERQLRVEEAVRSVNKALLTGAVSVPLKDLDIRGSELMTLKEVFEKEGWLVSIDDFEYPFASLHFDTGE